MYNKAKMKKQSVQIVVWKEEKHYVAQCLNVEVSSFGKTRKDALTNIEEALELYFEDEKEVKLNKVIKPEIVSQELSYA